MCAKSLRCRVASCWAETLTLLAKCPLLNASVAPLYRSAGYASEGPDAYNPHRRTRRKLFFKSTVPKPFEFEERERSRPKSIAKVTGPPAGSPNPYGAVACLGPYARALRHGGSCGRANSTTNPAVPVLLRVTVAHRSSSSRMWPSGLRRRRRRATASSGRTRCPPQWWSHDTSACCWRRRWVSRAGTATAG